MTAVPNLAQEAKDLAAQAAKVAADAAGTPAPPAVALDPVKVMKAARYAVFAKNAK